MLRRYAAGERYFVGADIPDGANIRGVNLEGVNLERAWLFDADFTGANLKRVIFCGANLKCVNFRHANLEGAKFEETSVESILLEDANLKDASFTGAYSHGHRLKDGERP